MTIPERIDDIEDSLKQLGIVDPVRDAPFLIALARLAGEMRERHHGVLRDECLFCRDIHYAHHKNCPAAKWDRLEREINDAS